MNFKIGDKVTYISNNIRDEKGIRLYPGASFEKGLSFTVTDTYNDQNRLILYGGKNGKGVYSEYIVLTKDYKPKKTKYLF